MKARLGKRVFLRCVRTNKKKGIKNTKKERNFLLLNGFAWNDMCVRCWLWFRALRESANVFCVTIGVTNETEDKHAKTKKLI